ncbi:hypothetical protein BC939DRAFT_169281 [Gamsiella multidivaricata]|uniref:uncharacterized protein n=1 Tax=Gamsiella multidivaricata TaxID=101098 RepID=UPI00221E97D7|nr:uncharacterized protein BC939DRAFT_169281 [Gamsiella multidivaricata]KAI7822980.1 hypothetical protein BC939DRAFT_169281 [Gamsiella multidivaricata]
MQILVFFFFTPRPRWLYGPSSPALFTQQGPCSPFLSLYLSLSPPSPWSHNERFDSPQTELHLLSFICLDFYHVLHLFFPSLVFFSLQYAGMMDVQHDLNPSFLPFCFHASLLRQPFSVCLFRLSLDSEEHNGYNKDKIKIKGWLHDQVACTAPNLVYPSITVFFSPLSLFFLRFVFVILCLHRPCPCPRLLLTYLSHKIQSNLF